MRKRFGIDIDGTVTCPSSMVPFLNKEFNLNITLADIKQYSLMPLVSVSEQEFSQWFTSNEPVIYAQSPLANGARTILSAWSRQHELYFISARGEHLIDVTTDWFMRHNLDYTHIELVGSHNKIETARKFDVDIFFEDKHDNAVMIHEDLGIPVILFDTPYNQDPIPDGVVRVSDWHEAGSWVENWVNQNK
jgi:uncharacterized protein